MNNNKRRTIPLALVALGLSGTLLVVGCTAPGLANNDVASEPTSSEPRECRAAASSAGTKMRRNVCHTAAEWAVIDQRERNRKQNQDEFFRRSVENSALGPGPAMASPTAGP